MTSTSPKHWSLEGSEDYSETDHTGQAQTEGVPSACALMMKALKEPPEDKKKQKNIMHSGNTTFDGIPF